MAGGVEEERMAAACSGDVINKLRRGLGRERSRKRGDAVGRAQGGPERGIERWATAPVLGKNADAVAVNSGGRGE